MSLMYVVVGVMVIAIVVLVLGWVRRPATMPHPHEVKLTPHAAGPARPADLATEVLHKVQELERLGAQTSPRDEARARALYEEAMALAETSGGRRDVLLAALDKLAASREAKHTSGLAEAGYAEVLRHAALAVAPPSVTVLEKSLEYAQKATAQNSLEGEAWVAYAHALVATGSADDGIAVMNDHQAYTGYRMYRARAAAALAKGEPKEAAGWIDRALAGCSHEGCRAALEAMRGA